MASSSSSAPKKPNRRAIAKADEVWVGPKRPVPVPLPEPNSPARRRSSLTSWKELIARFSFKSKRNFKSKPGHMIEKQGFVKFVQLTEEEFETKQREEFVWTRARLLFVETSSGHVIEFYSSRSEAGDPDPITQIACLDIEQAACSRTDGNTFIIHVKGRLAFLIKSSNQKEMTSWLTTLWKILIIEKDQVKVEDPVTATRASPPIKIVVTDAEGDEYPYDEQEFFEIHDRLID